MKPFLTVYGSTTVDHIMTVPSLPVEGITMRIASSETVLGGVGMNVALTAARLGCPAALCSFVGQDFPAVYRDLMRECSLITDEFVAVDDKETSKAIIIDAPESKQMVLFYQGPMDSLEERGVRLLKNASESEYVHFCTGQPRYYISTMKMLKRRRMALDPAQESHYAWGPDTFREALPMADALFCNKLESDALSRHLGSSVFDADLDLIVCTLGSEGSLAVYKNETMSVPAVKADKVVDVTGAGDSFRGGFYAALYRGYKVPEALVIASATASFVVESIGPLTGTPSWDNVIGRAEPYFGEIS